MSLSINNLNKSFGNKIVLNDFSYEFTNGVYGLLAPNGAGKTTLLRCICNLYTVKNNTIFYNGESIEKSKSFISSIGYLPQNFGLFRELTVYDSMSIIANLKGLDKTKSDEMINSVLSKVNLSDCINDKIKTLSGGMIRRVGIAQALIGNPKIIIFDEPTAGLDPEERLRFKNIVSSLSKDKIVIISTHIIEDVESLCDHIIIMKKGTMVCSGSCEEIAKQAEDKVYIISGEEIDNIKVPYSIQKYFERDGEKFARIISNSVLPFEKAKPNVEDGYLCVLDVV